MSNIIEPGPDVRSGVTMGDAFSAAFQMFKEKIQDPQIKRVVLMVGIPGSGKSTFIANNKDASVLFFDSVGARPGFRKSIIRIANEAGKPIDAVFVNTPLKICMERNEKRDEDRRVPQAALERAAQNLREFPPTESEGFRKIVRIEYTVKSLGGTNMNILAKQGPPPTEIATLIFDKDKFETRGEATKWARDHDFSASKVDETESSFRLRQRRPGDFVDGSFRTINIDKGIKAVIGRLKPALRKASHKRPSREYLEAALAQAKKLLPGWMYATIHRAAFPSSGGRANANRRRASATEKAWIEKAGVEAMAAAELRSMLHTLNVTFAANKRQGKDIKAVLARAKSVVIEMKKRGLSTSGAVVGAISKQQPTATEVSVPVPLGTPRCGPGQRYDSKLDRCVEKSIHTPADCGPNQRFDRERGMCVDKVAKGFLNGTPEAGMHAHGLDRRNGNTFNDGASMHMFVMPGTGELLITFEDGSHAHVLSEGDNTERDGAHTHKLELPNGQIVETKLGGEHTHTNMVETTAFDGLHKHTLVLPDGQTIESLSPQEFVDHFKLDIVSSPIETASQISRAMLEVRILQQRIQELSTDHLMNVDEVVDGFAKTGIIPDMPTTSWEVEHAIADGATCVLEGMASGFAMSNPLRLDISEGDIVDVDHEGAIVGFSMSSEPDTVDDAVVVETYINEVRKAVRTIDFTGPSDAKIVFVCASPSSMEFARMEALVGPDGAIFKDLYLDPLGIKKSEVAIGFAIPVATDYSDTGRDVGRWRDYLVKSLTRFPKARVVSFGRIAKAALGPITSVSLPHPAGVRRHGNSGEVGRKLRALAKSLDKKIQTKDDTRSSTDEPSQGQSGTNLADSISGLRKDGTFRVSVIKSLPEKQIVYGVVLDPYQVDLHNDWIPPAEIEATAHDFLEKSRVIGLKHKGLADAKLVESWVELYPEGQHKLALLNQPHTVFKRQFGDDTIHSGAWIAGVRLSDELWATYKTGELDAFSIGGFSFKSKVTSDIMPKVKFVELRPAA